MTALLSLKRLGPALMGMVNLNRNTGGGGFPAHTYNFKSANTQRIREGFAAQRAGSRNMNLHVEGDSTVRGAGTTLSLSPYMAWPKYFADLLDRNGYRARSTNSACGTGISSSTTLPDANNDDRWVFGTGWVGDGNQGPGGKFLVCGSPNNTSADFTPPEAWDTCHTTYVCTATSGVLALSVNAGADLATINTRDASPRIAMQTITTTLGANTIKTRRTVGPPDATIRFMEHVTYNSALKQVNVINRGWSGSRAEDWATVANAYSPAVVDQQYDGETLYAVDAAILCVGINNWNNATDIETFKASLRTWVAARITSDTDPILMSGVPSTDDPINYASQETQRLYCEAMKEVALECDVPFIDLHAIWGTRAAAAARGWYGDNVHPNEAGYEVIAQKVSLIFRAILRLANANEQWTPIELGSLVKVWQNADRNDLITAPGGVVSDWIDQAGGIDLQATGGEQPAYSLTSFNGAPSVDLDGVDDFLAPVSQPASLPVGAAAGEIYALVDQRAPASDATTGTILSYGGATGTSRRVLQKTVVSGVNRATAGAGDGTNTKLVTVGTRDFSGRCVIGLRVFPTSEEVFINTGQSVIAAAVPATGTNAMRVGISQGVTSPFKGGIREIVMTSELSTLQSARLRRYLHRRRRLS